MRLIAGGDISTTHICCQIARGIVGGDIRRPNCAILNPRSYLFYSQLTLHGSSLYPWECTGLDCQVCSRALCIFVFLLLTALRRTQYDFFHLKRFINPFSFSFMIKFRLRVLLECHCWHLIQRAHFSARENRTWRPRMTVSLFDTSHWFL